MGEVEGQGGAPPEEGQPPAEGTPQGSEGQGSNQPWYAELSELNRGLAELKGWDSPDKALDSYREYEKWRGVPQDELLRLPKEGDLEGLNELYGRLGRPEKPEEYDPDLKVADGQIDLRPLAHKLGLSPAQYKAAQEALGEISTKSGETSQEQKTAAYEADVAALQKEWGQEFEANKQAALKAQQHFGISDEMLDQLGDAWGVKAAVMHMARLGRGLREDGFVDTPGGVASSAQGFGLTPAAAKQKLESLHADPAFRQRLLSDDENVRRQAMAERARLNQVAYADEEPIRLTQGARGG